MVLEWAPKAGCVIRSIRATSHASKKKVMRRPTLASYWHYNSEVDEESDESKKLDPKPLLSEAKSELVESESESVLELEVEASMEGTLACTGAA